MDFGLLYENDNGEYVLFNDVHMADIHLASLVYLRCLRLQVLRAYCTFASKQAVSITLFGPGPNNKGEQGVTRWKKSNKEYQGVTWRNKGEQEETRGNMG